MSKRSDFIDLTLLAIRTESLRKLVFSRPDEGDITKVTARLVAHRGQRLLTLEYSLPGNTVSHKNVSENECREAIAELLVKYRQANLITSAGDAEWKLSAKGKEALLGADKLTRKLSGEEAAFESAIGALDNKKNYILSGSEDFLIALGISDKSGRPHDKRQGKFRQINRFLEHIENIYDKLPRDGELIIYDLCCGKSYLSFAVYYYLTVLKKRQVSMLGIDLKRDVIEWCSRTADALGYSGMRFVFDDVRNTPRGVTPHMVISLHACDIATDIVLRRGVELGAEIILSTPCCHRYMKGRLTCPALKFVTRYPHLEGKLCDTLTDALRASMLESEGYVVDAIELTDPDDTPKNTLIRATKGGLNPARIAAAKEAYQTSLRFLFGDEWENYLKEIE